MGNEHNFIIIRTLILSDIFKEIALYYEYTLDYTQRNHLTTECMTMSFT